jgi:DNA-binding NtrC family response regulator
VGVAHRDPSGGPAGDHPAAGSPAPRPAVLCVRQHRDAEIGRFLGVLGTPIRYCTSGGEAIAIARAGALCCVISPALLPDMAAAQLIDELHRVAPGLAVIVIVDGPLISEAVEVMRRGAHAVIDSHTLHADLLRQVAPLAQGR